MAFVDVVVGTVAERMVVMVWTHEMATFEDNLTVHWVVVKADHTFTNQSRIFELL